MLRTNGSVLRQISSCLTVVTEGVETEAQRDRSSETSTIAQGYFFSDALMVDDANKLLRQGNIEAPALMTPKRIAASSGKRSRK